MTRDEIANELLNGCPDELRAEHEAISDRITTGADWADILDAAENLPETYVWLKNNPPAPVCRNCGERPATGRLFCDTCKDNFPALEDVEEHRLENEIL